MAGNYVLADWAGRLYVLPNVTLTVSEIRISFSLIFALVQYLMALLHTNNYEEPILFLTPQNVHASIILSNMSC